MFDLYEINRGNKLYRQKGFGDIQLAGEKSLDNSPGKLTILGVYGRILVVQYPQYIFCLDAYSKTIEYEAHQNRPMTMSVLSDCERLYYVSDGVLYCYCYGTGVVWSKKGDYSISGQSEKNLYVTWKGKLNSIDKSTGEVIWSYNGIYRYPHALFSDGEYVIVKDAQQIHCIKNTNCDVINKIELKDFVQQNFRDELIAWKKRPGVGKHTIVEPIIELGCLIRDKLFLSVNLGVVACIDVLTGNILWNWKFPEQSKYSYAKTLLYWNDKIVFHNDSIFSAKSYLYCLHASTGESIFESTEIIAESGCAHAVMVDKNFVGGSGSYIAAWDMESYEKKWQYQHKDPGIFTGKGVVFDDGLIFVDSLNKIIWFKFQ